MAITRSQIARQLLQFGGGADAGGEKSPGGGTFGGASKSPDAGGDTNRSRIQQDRQADFKAQTQRQNVDAMREGLRKNISPSFGERVGSFIKGGGVLGGLLRNFIKSSPEIFSDFKNSQNFKQFLDKRKQRKIDTLSEEDEDSDEDKQLNVITKLIEDQGLMEVPSAVIDQGLMEAPGDNLNLDKGLMVAPGSIIDQGLITAPSSMIDQGLTVPLSVGGRVNAMGGGIMDLNTARQMMFIGGIAKAAKKAVKKATRAVKSIAKSPLGKAALLGLATVPFGGPAGAFRAFKDASPLTQALVSGGILMGAPFIFGSDDKDEVILPENLGPELTPAQLAAIQSKPFGTLTPRIAGSQFVAEGGRIGYKDGPKFDVQATGSKSGKQQIKGAPEGITMDSETLNAIINANIPITEKINLLGRFKYGKGRTRIEKDDQEIFMDEGGFKSRDIGLGFNNDGKGIGGTLMYNIETGKPELRLIKKFAEGGRIGYQEGSKEPVAKKTMPLLEMGGKEMDLRDNGGFVPIGRMEKADDVPARLSKNEFVFTADAVRNAGDGSVDKGAEVMYNMMKNLEAGGDVSEESQGLKGARRMFQTSQRLEEVL